MVELARTPPYSSRPISDVVFFGLIGLTDYPNLELVFVLVEKVGHRQEVYKSACRMRTNS